MTGWDLAVIAGEEFADRLAKKMRADERSLDFEALDRTASAHFIGGMPIAETTDHGVVDSYQRAFGQPGLHIMAARTRPVHVSLCWSASDCPIGSTKPF